VQNFPREDKLLHFLCILRPLLYKRNRRQDLDYALAGDFMPGLPAGLPLFAADFASASRFSHQNLQKFLIHKHFAKTVLGD